MDFRPGRLDVVYEGRFARPCVDFVLSPAAVVKSVFNTLTTRWSVATSDVSVASRVNEVRLNEVRIKLTLFNGQGTLEMDVDKIGGHFTNALFTRDLVTIGDCLA